MGKSSKYKKQKREKLNKEEVVGIITVFCASIFPGLIYFISHFLYSKYVMSEYFYYVSSVFGIISVICWILNLVFMPLSACFIIEKIKWLAKITTPIAVVLLLLPFLFLSSGIGADETSIKKFGFGKVKQEYSYSEINSCEMYFYEGFFTKGGGPWLGYEIVFDDGEKFDISHGGTFFETTFKNDTSNLVEFNKTLAKNCDVTLDGNSDELVENYFDNKADYKYFKRFIKNSTN